MPTTAKKNSISTLCEKTVEKKLGEYRFLTDKSLSLKVVIQAMKNALVSRESIQKQIHYKWFCR